MADMTFFDGFTITWSQDGGIAMLSQEAVKAGWAFVGDTPPAREQFNAVHWMDGRRQQWLFGQIKGVTDQAGMPLSAGATNTLWLAIKAKLDLKQDGLGFTPVQQGGGAGQGSNKVYIGWAGGSLRAQVDATDLGSFVFASRQFTAGSGLTGGGTLESDRVLSMGTPSTITADSQNAAGGTTHTHAFNVSLPEMSGTLPVGKGGTGATTGPAARTNLGLAKFLSLAALTAGPEGSAALQTDDGTGSLIVKWGRFIAPSSRGEGVGPSIVFPDPFPNACFHVSMSDYNPGTSSDTYDCWAQISGLPTASGFNTYIQNPGNSGNNNWRGLFWFAIGN